ncbi:hypothetical protein [Sinomonas susongensis]|uniref:hypothetical protein n=1 Tax=Sinomonas susongensis TaxID=1324851 RepID=UPI001FE46A80|nr:hypothetical protein [Sinomonas susongensis]
MSQNLTGGSSWDGSEVNDLDEIEKALTSRAWEKLQSAYADFQAVSAPAYDEVLRETSERIRVTGSIGKADIGALLFWKRLRADTPWVRALLVIGEAEVRAATRPAVDAVNDEMLTVIEAAAAGRRALAALPGLGVGDALASALLLAAAPTRMAVYDRRAQIGLESLGLSLSRAPGRYARYMKLVEDLRGLAELHGFSWSARDVDLALYSLGGLTSKD